MVDVLEAVYWEEAPAEFATARWRRNPLRRRTFRRLERETAEAESGSESGGGREPSAAVDLARRAGRLVGLGHQTAQTGEMQTHPATPDAVAVRRGEVEAERAALFRRVRQAAALAAEVQRGAQIAAHGFEGAQGWQFPKSGRWPVVGETPAGAWAETAQALRAEAGIEELDRGFERDARRGF